MYDIILIPVTKQKIFFEKHQNEADDIKLFRLVSI